MQNRVIIITGASSGIGAACARQLAESSRLVLVARRGDKLQELAEDIGHMGGQAIPVVADLCRPDAAELIMHHTIQQFGTVSWVINNAGVFLTQPAEQLTPEIIDETMALNVRAPMLLNAAAIPLMRQAGGGGIIHVSSIAAQATFTAMCSLYSASKAALDTYTRVLREELRPDRIRVTSIAPGATDTEIWQGNGEVDRHKMCRSEDIAHSICHCVNAPPHISIDALTLLPATGTL